MAKTFEDALTKIRAVGEKGLSLAKIGDIWPGNHEKKDKARLADLNAKLSSAVREGLIDGPFKDRNSKLYFAPGRGPTLEKITAQISEFVLQSGVKLISKTGFEKLIKGPSKGFIADALRNAVSERLIIELTSAKSKLYLHRDVAAERLGFETKAAAMSARSSPPKPAATFTLAEFLPIYRRLKAEQGDFSAVKIYDVIRASGVDKEAVHGLLIAQAKTGSVAIHHTTSVELPREVIDAGIRLDGFAEPFITVVVKDDR